ADGGSDGGPAADCSGVMPPAPGSAIAIDVPAVNGEACNATAIDSEGAVAADAESSSPTTWFVFGTNGTRTGTFTSPVLFAQPKGFIGLSAGRDALMVTFWTGYAEPTVWEPAVAMGPGFGSGIISLSATST